MDFSAEVVIASIGGYMDSIARLASLIFIVNAVTLYATVSGRSEVVLGPVQTTKKHAAYMILFVNVFLGVGICIALLRLGGLLSSFLPDSDDWWKGVTTLISHPFILNPYAFSGDQYRWTTIADYLSVIGFWALLGSTFPISAYIMKEEGLLNKEKWRLLYWYLPLIMIFPLTLANGIVSEAIIDHIIGFPFYLNLIKYMLPPAVCTMIGIVIATKFMSDTKAVDSPGVDRGQS